MRGTADPPKATFPSSSITVSRYSNFEIHTALRGLSMFQAYQGDSFRVLSGARRTLDVAFIFAVIHRFIMQEGRTASRMVHARAAVSKFDPGSGTGNKNGQT